MPTLAELEACPELILSPPHLPTWALDAKMHRRPSWLRGAEEIAADADLLDLSEISFTLPNAIDAARVRMNYWQYAYVWALSLGGFSAMLSVTSRLPYVKFKAWKASQGPHDDKPTRPNTTVARVLEDASIGQVVTYQTHDRLDLRPHAISLIPGTGRENTRDAILLHLHRKGRPLASEPSYKQLLAALQARLDASSSAYRKAFLMAEEKKRGTPQSENPFMSDLGNAA